MSLLTICQDAAEEIGILIPSTIFGNTAYEAKKLLRYAQKMGKKCLLDVAWQQLRKEHTFSALAQEEQTGILPSDFNRFVPLTMWNRTNETQIKGAENANEWQRLKAIDYSDTSNRKYIYRGGSVFVLPIPTLADTIAFEYVTKNYVLSALSAEQEKFLADTDTSKIDEELLTLGVIYEYLQGDDLPYQMALIEYEKRKALLLDSDLPEVAKLIAGDIFAKRS